MNIPKRLERRHLTHKVPVAIPGGFLVVDGFSFKGLAITPFIGEQHKPTESFTVTHVNSGLHAAPHVGALSLADAHRVLLATLPQTDWTKDERAVSRFTRKNGVSVTAAQLRAIKRRRQS